MTQKARGPDGLHGPGNEGLAGARTPTRRGRAQKIEHFQIAAYGTTAALAGQLDRRDEQRLLHRSLEEEKVADEALARLAVGEVDCDAVAA